MSIEATFRGYIETTQDTLLIFEACRRGILPRICRRLQEKERKIVTSGSVFVFDERESGIKRWTDGLVWSPSRILGNFLIYRELDKRAPAGKKDSTPVERQRSNSTDMESQTEKNKERALVGSLTNSYRFKKGGLIKKTMSIMVNGVSQHMISYYTKEDVLACKLKTPSSLPSLAILEIAPEFLLKQNFRIPPVIESTYDQGEQNSPSTVVSTVTTPVNMHVGSSLTMNFQSTDHSIFIAELEGMTYGGKQSSVSSTSPHAILPKPGTGGTVSPTRLANMDFPPSSRIKIEMESSNQSGVDLYRSTYSTGSNPSGYPSAMQPSTHYTSYATSGHPVANGPDGSHTLPMPPMRAFMNRQPSYEFPPITSHVNTSAPPRLLTSQPPLIPNISSNQNDYNNYYHSPPPSGNSQTNGNWSDYPFSSYSSSNQNNSHGSGSQPTTGNLASIAHQAQSSNNSQAETSNDMFYATATATTGNDSATHPNNTLPFGYHDLSSSLPELYNSAHSPTTTNSAQSNQHEHLASTPSPTLPAISSPSSTVSTSNNSSSNAPMTPPLSSPNTNNNATIVNPGNGSTNIFNSNYPPYYSSWIKNEGYPTVSMPPNSFMYDPYLVRETWN